MNIGLLESFGQNYPEELDGTLDCSSIALTCRFNRWGSLFAVGCNDGRILIFDFTTRGIAKVLAAHVQPVCSLSWSRDGRKLVTASTDNTVAIWDVLSGDCKHRFRFPSPVMRVQFHPRQKDRFLICPMKHASVLITQPKDDTNIVQQIVPVDDELVNGPDSHVIGAFDRRGRYIITGNGKGKVGIVEVETMRIVHSFRQQSTQCIRSIEVARGGSCFLTNSNDRIIRIYDLDEILTSSNAEPVQKLQDLVNKTPWKVCCFSGDDEYVCAGSARTHSISIWECKSGSLVKILHGIKGETLLDLVWHPSRPLICSISNVAVTIWSQSHVENWSAFAPDFKELDENVEYEERESEFDLEDDDRSVHVNSEQIDEDVEVNVDTVTPVPAFCSSDEEDDASDGLWFLPIAPEIDDPEENPYATTSVVPPTSANGTTTTTQTTQRSMRSNSPSVISNAKLPPPIDVSLPAMSGNDEVHPILLGLGGGRKRTASSTAPSSSSFSREAAKRKGKGGGR